MLGAVGAASPHETFFYYYKNNLEAIRDQTWKLHVRKEDQEIKALYNLIDDPGETQNLYESYPSVVENLTKKLAACREDLGDEAVHIPGQNVRSKGKVDNPATLTHFDPDHPYIIAMYDLKDRG